MVTQTHELPPSVAVFVADALEEQILNGQRVPGAPLHQLDLAAEFGVSRVPVRDALAVLEQRHLAVRVPRKGVIVRPISAESVRQVFAARRLLEAEITRLAAARITPEELDALEAVMGHQRTASAAHDLSALRSTDREFHAVIWRASGNEVLEELIRTVWLRALQARSVGHRVPGWGEKSIDRHVRIVDALRRRDAQDAIDASLGAVDAAEREILEQIAAVAREGSAQ
jgi:DNA-binding GntR family transcriptional regulator